MLGWFKISAEKRDFAMSVCVVLWCSCLQPRRSTRVLTIILDNVLWAAIVLLIASTYTTYTASEDNKLYWHYDFYCYSGVHGKVKQSLCRARMGRYCEVRFPLQESRMVLGRVNNNIDDCSKSWRKIVIGRGYAFMKKRKRNGIHCDCTSSEQVVVVKKWIFARKRSTYW